MELSIHRDYPPLDISFFSLLLLSPLGRGDVRPRLESISVPSGAAPGPIRSPSDCPALIGRLPAHCPRRAPYQSGGLGSASAPADLIWQSKGKQRNRGKKKTGKGPGVWNHRQPHLGIVYASPGKRLGLIAAIRARSTPDLVLTLSSLGRRQCASYRHLIGLGLLFTDPKMSRAVASPNSHVVPHGRLA